VIGCKIFNENDAFHLSAKKSPLSLIDTENINSIDLDNVSKAVETVKQTMTSSNNGK